MRRAPTAGRNGSSSRPRAASARCSSRRPIPPSLRPSCSSGWRVSASAPVPLALAAGRLGSRPPRRRSSRCGRGLDQVPDPGPTALTPLCVATAPVARLGREAPSRPGERTRPSPVLRRWRRPASGAPRAELPLPELDDLPAEALDSMLQALDEPGARADAYELWHRRPRRPRARAGAHRTGGMMRRSMVGGADPADGSRRGAASFAGARRGAAPPRGAPAACARALRRARPAGPQPHE